MATTATSRLVFDDLEIATAEWVDWFNHRRRSEYCDNPTPLEVEGSNPFRLAGQNTLALDRNVRIRWLGMSKVRNAPVRDQRDRRIALSKELARMLRHRPDRYGLELDDAGWVAVDEVLAALSRHRRWSDVAREDLAEVIRGSDKRRYELSGASIRALYGHSTSGRIAKTAQRPPGTLFHGTATHTVSEILTTGLLPMRRQYVHLSTDRETATQVGGRKAADVAILEVDAAAAHEAGVEFFRGNDQIWLAESVPPRFLHPEARD
ncbi:RNA:NAD 2'-phosphotransferase, TPT1/KptA family [Prauserella aidingensis]|nr:RNA:NAD 2'-phosphotransferase, TPT1/KptA family [Prauserella aidingensis]